MSVVAPPPASSPPDELRGLKLGQIRTAFSPAVYRRSAAAAFGWLAVDLGFYVLFVALALLAPHPVLAVGAGILAGVAVASLFVWAHDAAHGALFGSARLSEVLGSAAMLPSFNVYRLWVHGHNKVHHGFTSFSPIDWIWRPKTPEEYLAASRPARLVYRIERSLPGCGLHYVLRVWWPGMVRYRGDAAARRRHRYGPAKALTFGWAAVSGAAAFWAAGITGLVCAVVLPWVVFNYFIAFFVYLHHTHPRTVFYDDRRQWSAPIGQLACSTIVRASRWFEAMTHSILVHTPHHVDTRIPFYRLRQAWGELREHYGHHVVEYRFRWSTVRSIFRSCQLYDFRAQVWLRFRDLRDLPALAAAHKP
ncbi:MAG: fatty acid desaturase [Acidimicrobiales bacterium]